MRLSVILSTYNQPAWLEKVILGYAAQTHQDFELVIADDGSDDATWETIDRLRDLTNLVIRHVWHEDLGFRKCTILNRAIVESTADYLVFSDGDCVPRHNFLATHARHARRGRFLSGGYFKLPMSISHAITSDDVLFQRVTEARWLRKQGVPRSRKLLKLTAGPLGRLFDFATTTCATWNGHNSSGWKSDIMGVNGFDERMEWGAEDREMGERLMNNGIRGKRIRYRAICVHLDHAHGYVRDEALARNKQIREETKRNRAVWTHHGILKTGPQQLRDAIRDEELGAVNSAAMRKNAESNHAVNASSS
jgi:glycosyltransferase involved in cell wall biosynthesis